MARTREQKERDESPLTSEGKGRPTRSRKEAEAARVRPLVPADRKEAAKRDKQKQNELYEKQRIALETGDERYLPIRDKGKMRKFARDFIDARWSISEFLMPGMLLFLGGMLAISFIKIDPTVGSALILGVTIVFYAILFASMIEGAFVWHAIKARLHYLYPGDPIQKGSWFYAYSRMLMARRWRSPKPQVARGEFPTGPTKAELKAAKDNKG